MNVDEGVRDGGGTDQPVKGAGGAPRSPLAAVLLNLTGLALGYAYLGRWVRAVLYAAGVACLVFVAFQTDAADQPSLWGGIAAVWVGWAGWDAWRLARRDGAGARVTRRQLLPVAGGGLAVGAVVVGFVLYGAAGDRIYAEGLAAMGRADCATAVTKFAAMDGYELTLSRDVPAARTNRAQCGAFVAAGEARERGAFADAVARYRDMRVAYPRTTLLPFVRENLDRTFTDWGGSLRAAGDYPQAVRVYRELLAESGPGPRIAQVRGEIAATYFEQAEAARQQLLRLPPESVTATTAVTALLSIVREFGDTATAQRVPQAFTDVYGAATSDFAARRFCRALGVLDYFVTLQDAETSGIVATAHANRADSMLECGLEQFRTSDYGAARGTLEGLVGTYPDGPQSPQARSAIIAARVGEATSGGSVVVPAPLGGNSPGPNAVTFYNDSPHEVHVLLAGPTAHELVLPPAQAARPGTSSARKAVRRSTGGPPRRCGSAPVSSTCSPTGRRAPARRSRR